MASAQAPVKDEPVSPGALSSEEEDIYEDAGDLEFYEKGDGANHTNNENLYSARLPDYLWKRWAALVERMGDDEEIRLGTLRTWNVKDANGGQRTKLRMLLNDQIPEHQAAPKEYDMELLDSSVRNTFVFSERDLPRFATREKARREAMALDLPTSIAKTKEGRIEKKSGNRGKYDNYSRVIPKQTKMIGKIHYELRVEPKDKAEEDRMVMQLLRDMEHPHAGMRILSRNKASAISNIGMSGQQQFQGFIKDAAQQNKPKKGEATKNARIPKDQLLDLIFTAFREFQYWSMKALRQRTQQPDAYLRQVLEEVAVLNKSGKFANTYSLSDAYRDDKSADAKVEAAQEDDEDDDEEEMEDVV